MPQAVPRLVGRMPVVPERIWLDVRSRKKLISKLEIDVSRIRIAGPPAEETIGPRAAAAALKLIPVVAFAEPLPGGKWLRQASDAEPAELPERDRVDHAANKPPSIGVSRRRKVALRNELESRVAGIAQQVEHPDRRLVGEHFAVADTLAFDGNEFGQRVTPQVSDAKGVGALDIDFQVHRNAEPIDHFAESPRRDADWVVPASVSARHLHIERIPDRVVFADPEGRGAGSLRDPDVEDVQLTTCHGVREAPRTGLRECWIGFDCEDGVPLMEVERRICPV